MRLSDGVVRRVLEPLCLEYLDCLPAPTIVPRNWTLPVVPTVYALLTEDDSVVYVGQSKNIRLRMAQHCHNPKKQKLGYDKIAFWTPQIVSPHKRLVLESILVTLLIPKGNQVVALRRTHFGTWTEITSLRWRSWKNKQTGDE